MRFNQNIHIELYCVGANKFLRQYEEQSNPYRLWPEGADKPAIWGYELVSKDFI